VSSLAAQAVASGVAAGSVYGLIGVGFSLSYRTTGVINFAQGDLVALGAYLTYWAWSSGVPLPIAVLAGAVLVGVAMGVIERLALRPLYRHGIIYAIMSTIGLSVAIQSAIQLTAGPVALVLPRLVPGSSFEVAGVRIAPSQLTNLGIALLLCLGIVLLMGRTKLGRGMRTLAKDRDVAALLGISASRLFFVAFALAGALAAVAGVLIGPDQGLTPTMGLPLGIAGFTAAVLGGLGNPAGALVGGIALAVVENLAVLYVTPDYKAAIAYALLVVVLLMRPQGLFGESGAAVRRV
jgi:branched-chain amino acid transport system permease protein